MTESKYSTGNSLNFFQENFAIIVLCLIFLAGGFFMGSIWTENKLMKGSGNKVVQQDNQGNNADDTVKKNNLDQMPEITDKDHVLGAEKPQIYLVEYSDYECPFCQRFHPTMKQVLEKYGDKVAWVYRHYPLSFHPNAQPSAEAAECIASLGGNDAFWKFTDEIFAQNEKLGGKLSEEAIDIAINASGVNPSAVQTCVDNGEMTEVVSQQQTGGATAGVSGTPGTILVTNDGQTELISGALPFAQVEQIIQKYLK